LILLHFFVACVSLWLHYGFRSKHEEKKMFYLVALLLVTFAPFIVLAVAAVSVALDNRKRKISITSLNKTYGLEA